MTTDSSMTGPSAPEPSARSQGNLRTLVHCLSIAVLILTGTFFVFLYRQVVLTRKNTAEMVRYLVQYEESSTGEIIENVRRSLDAYRRQNPEFTPIYVKYFGTSEPAPTGEVEPKVRPISTNATNTAR